MQEELLKKKKKKMDPQVKDLVEVMKTIKLLLGAKLKQNVMLNIQKQLMFMFAEIKDGTIS